MSSYSQEAMSLLCPRPILLILLAVLGANPFSATQAVESRSGFQPLVMLTEFDPWAWVVGSDSPSFVLYENGTVIYLRESAYVSTKLSPSEVKSFVSGLRRDTLAKLKDSYTLSDYTDLPTNVLVIGTDGTNRKTISVYGKIRSLKTESTEGIALPDELIGALRQVLRYDNANASTWMPEYIEVMIWPFDYAKGEVAAWPTNWPGLADKKTVERHKNQYSLFVPASQYDELKKFMAQIKPTQPVGIGGKKWAVSTRFPFPHETR